MVDIKYNYEQTLLRSKLEIQEETLRIVNQEIHNNIGQVLSLVKLQLNTLLPSENEEITETINFTKGLVGKAITDLRSLSKSLHPDRITELGLAENIRHELEMLEKTHLLQTRLIVKNSPYQIPVQTQTILFRIVQEAITNIVKHASASRVEIVMNYDPLCFHLLVQNDGVGITDKALQDLMKKGLGLENMKDRSEVIGAQFYLEETPEGGTTVKISLPTVV